MTAPAALGFRELCADLLRAGHAVRFTAAGTSMNPSIRAGDILVVGPATVGHVRTGDVVLYQAPRGLTAHRVVGLGEQPGVLRCRGDAPGSEDEAVTAEQLLGRVDDVERPRLTGSADRRRSARFVAWLLARARAVDRRLRPGW